MLLLELGHVDDGQVLLAAIQQVGQRQRGLGLAGAGGADHQEHADRLARIGQPGARWCGSPAPPPPAHAAGRRSRCSIASCRLSTVRISSDCMRPAGMPVQLSTISATAWPSTTGKISGCSPCSARSLPSALGQRCARSASLSRGVVRRPRSRRAPRRSRRRASSPPPSAPRARRARRPPRRAPPRSSSRARGMVARRTAISRSRMPSSVSISAMRRCRSSIGGGHRRLAHRHARAGGVDQADRLVGQLAARDVARRQPHRLAHRLVEDAHVVMLLQRGDQAAHHRDRRRPRSAPRP